MTTVIEARARVRWFDTKPLMVASSRRKTLLLSEGLSRNE
jgi:hypothetical protein